MSWSERLEVHLHPSSLSIRRTRPWSNGGTVRAVPLAVRGTDAAEVWREPLQALAHLFQESRERGSVLRVILSDHFARYAVVPWSADLVSDAERVAFARLTFAQIFGAASEGWEIALDDALRVQPAIAAAIDRGLLAALRELCGARRMRLASVVPALVRDVNRHRATLREGDFWFARIEPGRLVLALRRSAAWSTVRSRRLDAGGSEALAAALRQEAMACGAAPHGMLYLVDPGASVQSVPGWQVARLDAATAAAAAAAPRAAAARWKAFRP
ncbi:MAG: hypothetical protein IT532_15295 [Burkholderiales bacterium]|nr:hypothetical protein [Burkholderiales bacterium]